MRAILPFGPLTVRTIHLCIDMQNMFAEATPWHTPWMKRVLPVVEEIVRYAPGQTVFTRFIPADDPDELPGAWKRYYEHWQSMTLPQLDKRLLDIIPVLTALAPGAPVVDKKLYSPFFSSALNALLRQRQIDSIVVTGAETDVCVLAAVLHAVDLGFRVVLVTDAVCSGSDATHDALMTLYRNRFGRQIETATAETVLSCWMLSGRRLLRKSTR